MAFTVLCSFWTSLFTLFHPFYVSMVDINYNEPGKSLEVSVRIFTDDFEKALKNSCNCKIEWSKPSEKDKLDLLVNNYVKSHLAFTIDGKTVNLQFAGFEAEDASTWNYFEVKQVGKFKKLEITSDLMYDISDLQTNMFQVKMGNKTLTDKLDFPNKKMRFTF